MLGQLTSPLKATPPTPSTPLIPQSIVGANSPQLSTGVYSQKIQTSVLD